MTFTIAGTQAGFQLPIFLGLALAAAAGTIWLSRQVFRRPLAKGWVAPRLVSRLVPGRSPGREALKVALAGAGLTLLAVACARPWFGEVKETAHRRGVDLVVALDASRSMLSEDVRPNRLAQARVAVESLIDGRHGDRVGLVAFAKDAFVQSPLTTDVAAARLYLRAVDPLQMQQGGTDVGGALREAGELLAHGKHGSRAQAVVLLTDGEDWGESAAAQAKALRDAGVQLFTVAVGTEAGAPVPVLDARGRVIGDERDASGAAILTHANRAALAALTGPGQSFDLAGDLGAQAVGHALDGLQKGEIEEVTVSASAERFSWFALPAFALLLLGLWVSPSRSSKKLSAALAAALLALLPLRAARADVFHVPEAAAQRGAKAYTAGHYDEALKQFQAQKKQAEIARFNQGDALAAMGKTDAALEAFKTPAAALQGRDAYNRGTLQAKGEHRDAAAASLRQALVADPANDDARHNLEVVLAEQQKDQKQPKDQQQAKDQQQPKDEKQQPPKNGAPKDQQQQSKNGEQKGQQQPKTGDAKSPSPAAGALAQGEQPAPTRAERMLDALKSGDRLLPYSPQVPPERSTPDAHPW
ncbi:MAG TPA: VWA domain-containing protein [Myxococcales bacterium]|nr:VWA domain-containing protein [Myxococcales bacterium]